MVERTGITNRSQRFVFIILIACASFVSNLVFAENQVSPSFVFQGKLTDSVGAPLTETLQKVTFQIYDPSGTCLLYQEDQTSAALLNMTNSASTISLAVGTGTRSGSDPGISMYQVFNNKGIQVVPNSGSCALGPGYIPSLGDIRKLKVTLTHADATVEVLSPSTDIRSSPFSLNADSTQNYTAQDTLQAWTTATRPTPVAPRVLPVGLSGFNSTLNQIESWNGAVWVQSAINAASIATGGGQAYTLPAAAGTSGYVLTTNGAGGTSWAAATGGEPVIAAGTAAQYWRGDKTWQTLDTSVVPENTNLYFTNARAIAAPITGFTSGAGAVVATDTILQAIQKLDGNIAGKQASLGYTPVNRAGDTMTGTLTTLNVTVPAGSKATLADAPVAGTDAANKSYVDTAVAGATDASKVAKAGDTMTGPLVNNSNSASTALAVTQAGAGYAATFMGGNVGIGTTTPTGSGTTVAEITGSGASSTTTYGSLTLSNANGGTGTIGGVIDFKGGGNVLGKIRTLSPTGGVANGKMVFSAQASSTLVDYLTIDSTTQTSPYTLTLGALNGTVSASMGIYNTSASATSTGLFLANNATPVSSNIKLAYGSTDNVGTQFETANITAVKTSNAVGAVSADLAISTINAGTSSEKMRITSGGNVGIGVAPTAKLDVNGTVRFNQSATSALTFPATNGGAGNVLSTDGAGNLSWIAPSGGGEPVIAAGTAAQYWRGDKTWQTLNTTNVPEGTNLYYTNARGIASTLTGYTSGAGTVAAADTILQAIQKLDGNIAGKQASLGYTPVNKAGDTMTGTLNTLNVSVPTGSKVTLIDAPVATTDAANKTYVDTALANYLPLAGGTMSGNITMNSSLVLGNNTRSVTFKDSGANTAAVTAPTTVSTSYTLRLPAALPASTQALVTDTSGNLSWQAMGGGTQTVTTKAGNATLLTSEAGVIKVNAAAATAMTLPTAVGNTGLEYTIMNFGAGVSTITPNGAQTVNAMASIPLAKGDTLTFYSDGANWLVKAGRISPKTVTYTANSSWVVPYTFRSMVVSMVGGGGGGGDCSSGAANEGGGGGGGGAYISTDITTQVTPGNSYAITIGAGGASGSSGLATSFGALVSAAGGNTGAACNGGGGMGYGGGMGGTGTGAISGAQGGYGYGSSWWNNGDPGNGNNVTGGGTGGGEGCYIGNTSWCGGGGGGSYWGNGAAGGNSGVNGANAAANSGGGGGGGGFSATGGTGGSGKLVLTWSL